MLETELISFGEILVSVFFLALLGGNYFYQQRVRKYTDELLLNNPREFNKQITANAYIHLFGRGFLGVLSLLLVFYYLYSVGMGVIDFWVIVNFVAGIGFILFGVWGFRQEIKRKIEDI